ncbi:unnamed protein product, partial [Ixodes persulcatus]
SYSLTDKELAFVTSNDSLSDSVMNIAQYLTRKKFPRWGGFQDVLLAQGLKFKQIRDPFIQVLHTKDPDHWLTVSNIGAPPNSVFVYDSIDEDVPPDAVKQVCSILKLQLANINVFVKPAQSQGGTLDCGLFAIANMYCIASGKDPTTVSFRQHSMRTHLLNCLKKGVMTDFPI